MAVGYPTDKPSVDMISGQLCRTIETWAPDLLRFKAWLDGQTMEVLTEPPYNYTEDDVNLLKSAIGDLGTLAEVYKGVDDLTPARDLSVFAQRLAGIYL